MVLSQTARVSFKSAIVRDRKYLSDCADCKASAELIGQGNYPPSAAGEENIVREAWAGTSQMTRRPRRISRLSVLEIV